MISCSHNILAPTLRTGDQSEVRISLKREFAGLANEVHH